MMTLTEDQVLSDFQSWATKRGRTVDCELLAVLLSARSESLGRSPTVWAKGDVRQAMATMVTAHPLTVLYAPALAETLDSYLRFLRNTGRLARGSADLAALHKEARREVRSFTAMLEAFKALAVDAGEGDELDDELVCLEDPVYERRCLLRELGIRRRDLQDRWWEPLPPIDRAAAAGMRTRYLERLARMAEAVAPSIELEAAFLPRPADAWRIASELDLWDEIRTENAAFGQGLTPEMVLRSGAFLGWWIAAYGNGVIRIEEGVARPGSQPATARAASERRQLLFATKAARGRLDGICERADEFGAEVIELVVLSLLHDRAWRSMDDTASSGVRRLIGSDRADEDADQARASLRRSVAHLVEAGVLEESDGRARLTEFGAWVVDGWIEAQFED